MPKIRCAPHLLISSLVVMTVAPCLAVASPYLSWENKTPASAPAQAEIHTSNGAYAVPPSAYGQIGDPYAQSLKWPTKDGPPAQSQASVQPLPMAQPDTLTSETMAPARQMPVREAPERTPVPSVSEPYQASVPPAPERRPYIAKSSAELAAPSQQAPVIYAPAVASSAAPVQDRTPRPIIIVPQRMTAAPQPVVSPIPDAAPEPVQPSSPITTEKAPPVVAAAPVAPPKPVASKMAAELTPKSAPVMASVPAAPSSAPATPVMPAATAASTQAYKVPATSKYAARIAAARASV
ncbi:MAG: hypothetical protein WBQ60_07185, partial [Asticcacaulis sp.]